MTGVQEPGMQRRRLRTELKRARGEAGLTQRDVAAALDWSPSKLIRIENGSVGVSPTDLRALLQHYGISDEDRVEPLVAMARASRKPGWTAYRDILTREYMIYLDYEASCSDLREFESILVPGLLQTEEYAREIFTLYYTGETRIDRRYEVRQERQELLERADPPRLSFLLDEAVISRWIGGPGVMRGQLERLKELSHRDNITIQVVPFSLGTNTGLLGPMIVLQFADPAADDVLFLESPTGDTATREDPDLIGPYLTRFMELQDRASRPEDFDEIADRAISRLSTAAVRPVDAAFQREATRH